MIAPTICTECISLCLRKSRHTYSVNDPNDPT